MIRHRWVLALAAIATALVLTAADHANARVGGGSSSGSRGSRTFSAPPSTHTAPGTAAPMQRSVTQPNRPSTAAPAAQAAARPGLFGGGMLGGLAAGFIGAGLFGMLFGHGMFGGMGGFASILGLILQVVLIVVVARLAFAWWQRRNAPSYAASAPNAGATGPTAHSFGLGGGALGGGTGGGLGGMFGGNSQNQPAGEPITIDKPDYDAFEQLLGNVQAAYSAEDISALRRLVTPEMLSYFSEDMAENASRGLINQVSDVKLLQGDLAEAWREGNTEFASVAMRFALHDRMVDRASGRAVEDNGPSEVTELWTFMRAHGGAWVLSAIQQS